MLEIKNRTSYRAAIVPTLDPEGRDGAVVVIKGTFGLAGRGDRADELPLAEPQVDVHRADVHRGDATSSILYASESHAAKAGTDVVLVGHAHSPIRPVPALDVGLTVGRLAKVVRVFGDRRWLRAAGRWIPSEPIAFTRMPLVWERSFGGADASRPDARDRAFEEKNPVGVGFTTGDPPEAAPLPNLEDPGQLLSAPRDRPPPAGFGFVAPSWMPRRGFAGTLDDAWRERRCPLPPLDFDPRFWSSAPAGLWTPEPLGGGERVIVQNASARGNLSFALPRRRIEVAAIVKGVVTHHAAVLDTVLIEPDDERVVLTWRAVVPCARNFLHLDVVRVSEAA